MVLGYSNHWKLIHSLLFRAKHTTPPGGAFPCTTLPTKPQLLASSHHSLIRFLPLVKGVISTWHSRGFVEGGNMPPFLLPCIPSQTLVFKYYFLAQRIHHWTRQTILLLSGSWVLVAQGRQKASKHVNQIKNITSDTISLWRKVISRKKRWLWRREKWDL